MDQLSKQLAEDIFLREPVDARIRKQKEKPQDEDPHPTLKVEMQTIRLHPDSQKLLLDTLRFIHGPDFKFGSASNYKDKGSNLGNKYWMERGNLVVQGGFDYSLTIKDDVKTPEVRLREFALAKLERYHFHKAHCSEALQMAEESTDKALEILSYKYFNAHSEKKPDNIPPESELLEMRNDEIAVLESIYDSIFRIKDTHTWSVKISMNYLSKIYEKTMVIRKKENVNFKTKKKEVCKLFLSGPCRFGAKCKFLHEVKVENVVEEKSDPINYELEIRFPKDSVYPYESPLIFFKLETSTKLIPERTCLLITARLYEEALNFTRDGIPCVYSLVELLNNEDEILNYIQFATKEFPSATDSLLPQLENIESNIKKPSHYSISKVKDNRPSVNIENMMKENREISKRYFEKPENNRYNKMMSARKKLPAWQKRNDILNAMKKSQVIVISGETGCGKSTQVPQYILDEWLENFNKEPRHVEIVCTQPRRISAIGVADRVAEERVEKTGQVVGYQIRLENKMSSKTRLSFCTTGILLRRLEYDPQITSVTHIIVDEVHERSEESDFLLLILRDLIKVRKDLRVVLMSATLNADLFSDYFDKVPVLEIPGRTFPVEQVFLEEIMDLTNYVLEENGHFARKIKKADKKIDFETEIETSDVRSEACVEPKMSIRDENLTISQVLARYPKCNRVTWKNLFLMDTEKINIELIEHVLTYIVSGDHNWPKEGAILIFLPGIGEIMSLHDQLAESHTFSPKTGKYKLIPLHSTLSSEEQASVFMNPGPGVRKIVLSTNIAETSVTIDDCVFVIDGGRMKEKRFDSNRNMESLDLVWVSRANAKQRSGRAGRVMPGVCIHLFTSHRYKYHIAEQPVPEIHRVPLEQLLLKLKILPLFQNMSVHEVLAKTIEPPEKYNIDGALSRLQDVGALDKGFQLTALGKHLASLPVDVRIGKLMLFGAIFCCVDSALTMAAFLSHKSPFVAPFGKKAEADAKRREFACSNSDQLTTLKAYKKWQQAMKSSTYAGLVFANEHYLSHKTLLMLADIKHQLLGLLASIGFVPDMPALRKKMWRDSVAKLTGDELNSNGNNDRLLATILCAALYPNVVKVLTPEKSFHMQASGAIPRQATSDELKFRTKSDGYVSLHPSSVNFTIGHYTSPYLVYQEKVKTTKVFIRECSMVPQVPLVLFSGCNLVVELHNGTFIVSLEDGWIMFQVENHEVAEMLKAIRIELINLLEEKINDPSLNLLHYEKGNKIINTIVQIVTKD
ncbi:putative ATP-dependent RNA helicase DHX57 isoform X1 [Pieris napi]|uniref:putative ATP-dependent RNA helicase DHX57 isoform X1 n=1 Tax=Pieris napi TaxID=78633 RepID=UPI001FBAEB25|nr:putative ATP-dependent RNA helicase DHX57 isoform X1 [Pieris napi]